METTQYSSQNTKIMWDLHEVIVRYNYTKIMAGIWLKKWSLIPLLYPKTWFHLIRWAIRGKYSGQTGEGWGIIASQYPGLVQSWIYLGNHVEPIPATVALINKLHQKGYEQELVSDIHSEALKDLEQAPAMQPILSLFSHKKSIDYRKSGQIFKNHPTYFAQYLQQYPSNKVGIFIDDLKPNVIKAREAGLTSIQFQSPDQLENEFIRMGMLEKNETT